MERTFCTTNEISHMTNSVPVVKFKVKSSNFLSNDVTICHYRIITHRQKFFKRIMIIFLVRVKPIKEQCIRHKT
jgi:hypothetical protein